MYLAKFDDEGTFGQVSLGRSFAYELGAAVPASDPRLCRSNLLKIPLFLLIVILASIENLGDSDMNLASDFIAQYTIRQAYRYEDHMPEHEPDWVNPSERGE